MTDIFKNEDSKNFWPVKNLLTQSYSVYAKLFVQISVLVAVLYVPLFLLGLGFGVPNFEIATGPGSSERNSIISMLQFFRLLLSIFQILTIAFLVEKYAQSGIISLPEAMKNSGKRFWPGFLTGIISLVLLTAASLLLIIPGLIFAIYFCFAPYAVALRNVWGWKALLYSKNLVHGHWWAVLGRFFVITVLVIAVSLLANVIFTLLGPILKVTGLFIIVPLLAQQLLTSFSLVALTLLFLNLEAVKRP